MGVRYRVSAQYRRRKILGLVMLLVLWSALLGWGLAASQAAEPSAPASTPAPAPTVGTVDSVPQSFALAQQSYAAHCASCHLLIPPQVLPTDSWREILLDPNHYGVELRSLPQSDTSLIWKYLQVYSRRLNPEERMPFRIAKSRYFKILHPKVDFPQPVTVSTCASCHPGASKYDFRSLSPEWQNSP
jgi:Dihaem cytochrome c